ncbi:hypothetical protein KR044_001261 [Drosophila immigrans]|nr:hypothetical protein KR044_001261 [Drosophila immigrans]
MVDRRGNNVKTSKVLMVLLRCFLSMTYLWLMLLAAAVIPEISKVTRGHLWFKSHEIYVTYSSMLSLDALTVPIVTGLIILMLFQLFKCCRCNFFGWICYRDTIRSGDKVPFDTRLLIYFGPFLMLFLLYWMSSICYIVKMLQMLCFESVHNGYIMCSQIVLALLFKLMIFSNVIIRCNRCFCVLKQFDKETRDYLLNSHNFGEHLNLFFQH